MHLFRVKVCVRAPYVNNKKATNGPETLCGCRGNSHGSNSSVTQNCTCKTLWRQNELTPFPSQILWIVFCSTTKLLGSMREQNRQTRQGKKKNREMKQKRFPHYLYTPNSTLPFFYDWITQVTKKSGLSRKTSYSSHPYHKFKEFLMMFTPLTCGMFSLFSQFTYAFYLSAINKRKIRISPG